MKNIVLMASGSGSNAENIIEYFRNKKFSYQFHIITNKKDAFVLERAKKMGVPAEIITKKQNDEGILHQRIKEINPDLIVVAVCFMLFPSEIVKDLPNKNQYVQPALSRTSGGKEISSHSEYESMVAK